MHASKRPVVVPCSVLALAGCAALTEAGPVAGAPPEPWAALQQAPQAPREERGRPQWDTGAALLQGFLGVSAFERVSVDGEGGARVDGDDGDLDQLPLIGGGGQLKLGGERVDLGVEGMLSFAGRADAEAFAVGGGGAAIAIDVDLLLFELYGGPFASAFLGRGVRVYAAAGPLMQFAEYDQSGDGLDGDGSGFGAGWYARTGLELVLPSKTLIGLGVRWSDSTVDLSGDLGDLEMEGIQALFTVSRGF